MLKEFKEFALKGNMIDMAVGIIIGAAFTKLVSSLVEDIIMPPIGLFLGRVDFSNLSWIIQDKTVDTPEVAMNYGQFINSCIDFLILSFVIFIVIRQMNRLTRKEKKKEQPSTKPCPKCYSDIHVMATRCPMCTEEIS